jgi:hypothetical protein
MWMIDGAIRLKRAPAILGVLFLVVLRAQPT